MKESSDEHDRHADISPEQEKVLWKKWLKHYLDRIPDTSWPPETAALREFLDTRMRGIFVEYPDELAEFFSLIDDALLKSARPEVMHTLVENLYGLRTQTFADYPSMERIARSEAVKRIGLTPLTPENTVGCKLEEDGGYLSIHITPSLTVPNFIGEFRQAMMRLAERLQSDPSLQQTHTVLAESMIAKDHPNIMQRLGFTISKNDPQKATISVEEFKNRWLKNS